MLQRGYKLNNGSIITKRVVASEKYDIYETKLKEPVLLIASDLLEFWRNIGYRNSPNEWFQINDEESKYYYIGKSESIIASIDQGPYPDSFNQLFSFSGAFRRSEGWRKEFSFDNAIWIEDIGKLFPLIPNDSPKLDDKIVFATFATAGVPVSTDSFERLQALTNWLNEDILIACILEAGLDVPQNKELKLPDKIEQSNSKDRFTPGVQFLNSNDPFKLPGRPYLENFFNDNIVDVLRKEKMYSKMGIEFPGATVLYGLPGCGKTFAVERFIDFTGLPSYKMDSSTIASMYIHETSRKISEVFDEAIKNAPSIIVIDEMEAYLTNRENSVSGSTHHIEELAEFLRRIPEATKNKVLIFAMTNMIKLIDPAILRRGRFDYIIEVEMPTKEEIFPMLHNMFSKIPTKPNLDFNGLAEFLEGKPLSDATFIVREAGKYAVKADKDEIDQECINLAIDSLNRATSSTNEEKRRIGFSQGNEEEKRHKDG